MNKKQVEIMKYLLILITSTQLYSTCFSQNLINPGVEGTIGTSSYTFPISNQLPGWQNINGTDPNCMANTFGSGTPDVSGSPNLTPYSGLTFVTGIFGNFVYPNSSQFFDEGIMQTVNGFTPGATYSIHFHQSVILVDFTANVSGCWDNSGSWEVFTDNTSVGITAPTITSQPLNSSLIDWEGRVVTFTATSNSHVLKFLPRDDDNNQTMISTGGSNGCIQMAIDSIWIEPTTVNFELQIPNDTICENECIDLLPSAINNSGNVSLSWDQGLSFTPISANTVCPTSTTIYTVIGMDLSGNTDTVTVQVTVNPSPTPNLGSDFILCDDSLLDATIPTGSYTWQDNSTNSKFNVNQPGIYWVDVTVNGCTTRDSVIISIQPLTLNGGLDLIVCNGDNITLTGSGLGSNTNYTWSGMIQNNVPFIPNTTTNFIVSAITSNGCQVKDSVLVTVEQLPIINAGLDIFSCDSSIVLTAFGAGPNGTYLWSGNVINNFSFIQTTKIADYIVTGETVAGCSGTDTVSVTILDLPKLNFIVEKESECLPSNILLTNTSTFQAGAHCIWKLDNQTIHKGCESFSYAISNAGTYDVTLAVTTNEGCLVSQTYIDTIHFKESPVASFNPINAVVSNLNPEVNFVNTSLNSNSYSWIFGDLSENSSIINPNHTFRSDKFGTFTVTLIATSPIGCSDTTYGTVVVEQEVNYYIPNAFTPNGDSHNPTFKPIFTPSFNPKRYRLIIYNRWGEVVFETINSEVGWDGTYPNGSLVQDGVYTWIIKCRELRSDKKYPILGTVTVLK